MRTKQLLNERTDFHIHSCNSDGENSVKEIVELALNREHLRVIALTDHNYFAKEYDLVPSVASDRHRKEQPFSSYGGYSFYKEMLVRLGNRKQEVK